MRRWESLVVAAVVLMGLSTSARASFLLGDWEGGSSDQWVDWGTQSGYAGGATNLPSPKYQFTSDIGTVTSGSSSLLLTQSSWNQSLAIKLEYIPGAKAAFFANTILAMDVTLPASTQSGWSQFYDLVINAPTWGFTSLYGSTHPLTQANWGWGSGNSPQVTHHLEFDYSAALASIPSSAGYVEFIFATNNDGVHNQYYFDNVQLIPEPASMSMLGVAMLLAARRRRSA